MCGVHFGMSLNHGVFLMLRTIIPDLVRWPGSTVGEGKHALRSLRLHECKNARENRYTSCAHFVQKMLHFPLQCNFAGCDVQFIFNIFITTPIADGAHYHLIIYRQLTRAHQDTV